MVENGEEIEVTEQNKLQYLNALAHYRLTRKVNDEIAAFLKGKAKLKLLDLTSCYERFV